MISTIDILYLQLQLWITDTLNNGRIRKCFYKKKFAFYVTSTYFPFHLRGFFVILICFSFYIKN